MLREIGMIHTVKKSANCVVIDGRLFLANFDLVERFRRAAEGGGDYPELDSTQAV